GYCLITDGREIENYLSSRTVIQACKETDAHEIEFSITPFEKFEDKLTEALKTAKAKPFDYAADKVKYARKFTEYFEAEDMSDELRRHLEAIIAKIRLWNG